jgi:hypothetical protein
MDETTIGGYDVLGTLPASKCFRAFRASRQAPDGERLGTLYLMTNEVQHPDLFIETTDAIRAAWPFAVDSDREVILPKAQLWTGRPWFFLPDSVPVASAARLAGRAAFASLAAQLRWLEQFQPPGGEAHFAHGDVRKERIALFDENQPLLIAPGWVAASGYASGQDLSPVRSDDTWHLGKLWIQESDRSFVPEGMESDPNEAARRLPRAHLAARTEERKTPIPAPSPRRVEAPRAVEAPRVQATPRVPASRPAQQSPFSQQSPFAQPVTQQSPFAQPSPAAKAPARPPATRPAAPAQAAHRTPATPPVQAVPAQAAHRTPAAPPVQADSPTAAAPALPATPPTLPTSPTRAAAPTRQSPAQAAQPLPAQPARPTPIALPTPIIEPEPAPVAAVPNLSAVSPPPIEAAAEPPPAAASNARELAKPTPELEPAAAAANVTSLQPAAPLPAPPAAAHRSIKPALLATLAAIVLALVIAMVFFKP